MPASLDRRSFLAGTAGVLTVAASASAGRTPATPTGAIRLGAPVWRGRR